MSVDLNIISKEVVLGVITVGIDLKDEVQDWLLKKIEKLSSVNQKHSSIKHCAFLSLYIPVPGSAYPAPPPGPASLFFLA